MRTSEKIVQTVRKYDHECWLLEVESDQAQGLGAAVVTRSGDEHLTPGGEERGEEGGGREEKRRVRREGRREEGERREEEREEE